MHLFYYILPLKDISGGNNNAPDVKWSDLGLPIIIVVCKSDLVKVEDAVTLKKAKFIQVLCRHYGSFALFYAILSTLILTFLHY
jgi:hypothetical protein